MRRVTGFGRRSGLIADDFDDPLLGVVNLFDIAMVFAVALVVALVFSMGSPPVADVGVRPLPDPGTSPPAPTEGGREVGRVLRLPDGSLVYTVDGGTRAPAPSGTGR